MSPSDEKILSYLAESGEPCTKRELANAFSIKGDERIALKEKLKDLEASGKIIKYKGGKYTVPKALPNVGVVEVTEISSDGEILGKATDYVRNGEEEPVILFVPDKKAFPHLKTNDRVLARLHRVDKNTYEAKVIRRLDQPQNKVLGIVQKARHEFRFKPISKRTKYDFELAQGDLNGAVHNDLALAEIQPLRGLRRKKVRIIDIIGTYDNPKAISMIALHEAGLREEFGEPAIKETRNLKTPPLKDRQDLRSVPLVTIDGEDARDFDDAVFAEPADDGFHIIVAIADVAYYVRPGSALDKEAWHRGNSTYFPDRVVPMLPEKLSNDMCSLRPDEDRASIAAHLWIDNQGNLKKYKFVRALIRSQARLVYEQVQAARDNILDDTTKPLKKNVIDPLYDAFTILDKARQRRGTLDLEIPEKQVLIDGNGVMTGIRKRTRLDSHRLVEEFMILANVAAASALTKQDAPCIYRVHDSPDFEKLERARDFLQGFKLSLPRGQVTRPGDLNTILSKADEHPYKHLIHEAILRSQSQAVYTTENIGHFGLALTQYAHFTSPIRRYADLAVHRSLIKTFGLGPDGLTEEEAARLDETAEHISATERTSIEAERNAVDRFTAQYLSERIGAEFCGRISGVTRFGLFISLDETGADGFVPIRNLKEDFFRHDEKNHALAGQRSGIVYRLGAPVTVRVIEADPLTAGTIFELMNAEDGADIPGFELKARNTGYKKRTKETKSHLKKKSAKSHKSGVKRSGIKRR